MSDQESRTSPFKYPARDGFKQCSRCEEIKGIENFTRRYKGRRSYFSRCRACRNLVHLLNKYGINEAEYRELWEIQRGLCKLCGKSQDVAHFSDRPALVIDHNHETGEVRGLLCNGCNTALGIIEKRGIRWLKKALRYLRA